MVFIRTITIRIVLTRTIIIRIVLTRTIIIRMFFHTDDFSLGWLNHPCDDQKIIRMNWITFYRWFHINLYGWFLTIRMMCIRMILHVVRVIWNHPYRFIRTILPICTDDDNQPFKGQNHIRTYGSTKNHPYEDKSYGWFLSIRMIISSVRMIVSPWDESATHKLHNTLFECDISSLECDTQTYNQHTHYPHITMLNDTYIIHPTSEWYTTHTYTLPHFIPSPQRTTNKTGKRIRTS